jgi:hypothetical protein
MQTEHEWREPEPEGRGRDGHTYPYGYPFRTCTWDGSIHPDDLLMFMRTLPILISEADWKYGWPHKFYIEGIPNPLAGKPVCVVMESHGHKHRQDKGPEFAHAKFYTKHLADASDFDALVALFEKQVPNIHWEKDEKGVKYSGYKGPGVY